MSFRFLEKFGRSEEGIAATEFALILPVLAGILLGTIDLGYGLWINRKLVAASQITGDLLARGESITNGDFDDAIEAAELVLEPFDAENMGYDIIGIRFDDDTGTPEIAWRETLGADEDIRFPGAADGLGDAGDGVVVVTLTFEYRPTFYRNVIGTVNMRETAILRGRKTPYVSRETGS